MRNSWVLMRNSSSWVLMRNLWVLMRNSWVLMRAHEDLEILMSSFHEEFCSWLFSDCSWVLRNAHESWRIAYVLVSFEGLLMSSHESSTPHREVMSRATHLNRGSPWRRPTSAGKTWTRYGLGSWPTLLVAILSSFWMDHIHLAWEWWYNGGRVPFFGKAVCILCIIFVLTFSKGSAFALL